MPVEPNSTSVIPSIWVFSSLQLALYVGVAGCSPSASHDRLVRGRFHSYGLLQQAIEKLSPRAGFATVKAERKLIQIIVQVLQADRTLVGSDQPALQQRDHQMHPGQELGCRPLAPLQHRHRVRVYPFISRLAYPSHPSV